MPANRAHKENDLRVLVVEDHQQTAETIELYLKDAGYSVTVSHNGAEALKLVQKRPFDLLLLDILLPGVDGRTILERVREASDVPIIMLTSLGAEAERVAGLNSGADDYMVKPFSPKELVARVGARLRGKGEPQKRTLICGALTLNQLEQRAWKAGAELTLTPTEFDLLAIFMAAPDRVFSRGDLVEKLFGHNHEGSEQTIASHVHNLRRAIEADPSDPIHLTTVFGVGYRFLVGGTA